MADEGAVLDMLRDAILVVGPHPRDRDHRGRRMHAGLTAARAAGRVTG